MENIFRKTSDGRSVWVNGMVVIEGICHKVSNGFIFCDASLNRKSWNITEKTSDCIECFSKIRGEQLKLF